ncbi:MAG: MarR family transcriptional regulator [Carnobacterium sp.]|jgi:DNA-binding MarR family transcriptional regulator|uniref:MarR family protein n=1 Tax=Carnobacterium maltaromaticum LMA28 TaxID=1234679 RepID=K8ER99_CARML|nr:MarR family transcriptional regulator [Carnobacterium maltaromaticum]AOA02021.1 MarR family transcriptional regulator [Carnobacterium maltaromaticum]KRN64531.1 MarR family transcriptional regulator [Carnobacterium maltaromaticum DSM 20342]MBC9787442.1 MarR family transcriptional regulator [Carnobacterium maltaromaticum]MCI1819764.1 MarR family transcriptional regulator [Carnobacterium maltaromaticum]CCO11091.2 marR family protein [Carnobacterium maltaromaticum LMA28]
MVEILRDIGTIARALDSIANVEFKNYKLSKGQYLYIVRIYENPGIIPDKLAELVKVDRTTAARSINKLVENGLIKKMTDPANKKIRRLYVTSKGIEVVPIIQKENDYSNTVALQGFTEEEALQFSSMLKKISTNIDSDWKIVKKGHKRNYLKGNDSNEG